MKLLASLILMLSLALPSLAATVFPASTNGNNVFTGANTMTNMGNILGGNGATITNATSTNVFYSSKLGCYGDSSVYSGGGHADDAKIQWAMDQSTPQRPVQVIVEGPTLIATNLIARSNCRLTFMPGAGIYLTNNANCPMLRNVLSGTSCTLSNFVVEGGIWNGNERNQSRYNWIYGADTVWVPGFVFVGFNNLTLRDVQMTNACTFAYWFHQGTGLSIEDCSTGWDGDPALDNHDGLHFWGGITNIYVRNFTDYNGLDDIFDLAPDEQVATSYSFTNNVNRVISGVLIDRLQGIGTGPLWRLYQTVLNGPGMVLDVSLRNFRITAANNGMNVGLSGGNVYVNRLLMEHMNITITNNYGAGFGAPTYLFSMDSIKFGNQGLTINDCSINSFAETGVGIGPLKSVLSLSELATNVFIKDMNIVRAEPYWNGSPIVVTSFGADPSLPFVTVNGFCDRDGLMTAVSPPGGGGGCGTFRISGVCNVGSALAPYTGGTNSDYLEGHLSLPFTNSVNTNEVYVSYAPKNVSWLTPTDLSGSVGVYSWDASTSRYTNHIAGSPWSWARDAEIGITFSPDAMDLLYTGNYVIDDEEDLTVDPVTSGPALPRPIYFMVDFISTSQNAYTVSFGTNHFGVFQGISMDVATNSLGTTVKGQIPITVGGRIYYIDLKQ